MAEAEQVLTADYDVTDDPIDIDEIDGLAHAIEAVRNDGEGYRWVDPPDRVGYYRVYWNGATDDVRIGFFAMLASYEPPEDVDGDSDV